MVLEFTENEMGMIIGSLDFYMRMYIGQYREILFDLRWYRDCSYLDDLEDQLRMQFIQIRNILLPDIAGYGWSGSYGIFNTDVDYRAGIAYDTTQSFNSEPILMGYRYKVVVDQFPITDKVVDVLGVQSGHVECATLLQRKNT